MATDEVGSSAASFFPYHEPATVALLILLAFLFLLPTSNVVAQTTLKAGLLGPIFIGLWFGTPLAGWLSGTAQATFTSLGYVGLLMLVFEGGLFTSLGLAKSNIPISLLIAATGILIPIGLSFLLLTVAFGCEPLQSFTAGAALSSTSLGTTFSILSAVGLAETRVGTVLVTAAMVDDVIALILLRVITGLGESSGTGATTDIGAIVGRTLGTSLALLAVSYVSARFIVIPLVARRFGHWLKSRKYQVNVKLGLMALVAFAYIAASAYAGTSVLLGAFVAGLVCASMDEASEAPTTPESTAPVLFQALYHTYALPIQSYLLAPLFFASIGFSIPIRSMFTGTIVWRGIVYTLLMTIGKVVCGCWILVFGLFGRKNEGKSSAASIKRLGGEEVEMTAASPVHPHAERQDKLESSDNPLVVSSPITPAVTPPRSASPAVASSITPDSAQPPVSVTSATSTTATQPHAQEPNMSFTVPTLLLGSAMVARGEIGLLISQVAFTASSTIEQESKKLLSEDLFLVITWAIVLCTVIGPVGVSLTAKWGKGKMPISWS